MAQDEKGGAAAQGSGEGAEGSAHTPAAHPCAPCEYAATPDDLAAFGTAGPCCRVGLPGATWFALADAKGRCAHFRAPSSSPEAAP